VRGGAGYFYDRISQVSMLRSAGQNQPYSVTVSRSGSAAYAASLAQPYDPTITVGWSPRWVTINTATQTGTSSNLSSFFLGPTYLSPTTYQWNLNIQYEFQPRWVLEVGYVGSRGIHQDPGTSVSGYSGTERNVNEAQLASPSNPINGLTTTTVANASLRVPYLGFAPGGLGADQTVGVSKFNSLQVTVRKQMSHGFQMRPRTHSAAGSQQTTFSITTPTF
jgi:hypothetical protein